jgi:hypothetical protein
MENPGRFPLMNSRANRRQFPRLAISEEARVYDENGRELGKVSEVSGNGMNIETTSRELAESLEPGRRMRITVLEPGSRATNVLDIIVHLSDGNKVGMEFVNIVPDQPL